MNSLKALFIIISIMISTHCFANPQTANSLAPMIAKTSPSVVNIKAQVKISDLEMFLRLQKNKQNPADDTTPFSNKAISVGSGVIVDAQKGYILTNAHVIDEAHSVVITLPDGHHYNAKIIGQDKPSDIALLQIPAKNLTAIPIGDSNSLQVGDTVVAIGNAYGLNETVTAGIVSALGRTALGIESYENFIQTDTPINPGNSGGALININGELVGINAAILSPERGNIGIGFAIPSNMFKSIIQQLIQYGNVQRGALGVGAQDIKPELAQALNLPSSNGAVITMIIPDSPAYQAGLQVGDIVTNVNGTAIKKANDVVNTIAFLRVNTKAEISIFRDKKTISFTILITDPKKNKEAREKKDPYLYGVSLKPLNIYSPLHGHINGIQVVSVEEDSNAWQSDLRLGDIILTANQQKVTDIDQLKKIVGDTQQDLILNVLRGTGALFLVISKG